MTATTTSRTPAAAPSPPLREAAALSRRIRPRRPDRLPCQKGTVDRLPCRKIAGRCGGHGRKVHLRTVAAAPSLRPPGPLLLPGGSHQFVAVLKLGQKAVSRQCSGSSGGICFWLQAFPADYYVCLFFFDKGLPHVFLFVICE
jgi:hypothetical protein